MHLLTAENAEAYLRERGWLRPEDDARVERLSGGVSNEVFYVTITDRPDFVLKQARAQLRTAQPWFSRLERIYREMDVLRACAALLDANDMARTPDILHEDRAEYAFAMSAAPRDHEVWKARLLRGEADAGIARQCGLLLGRIHAGTWQDAKIAEELADQSIFDELRLDPYYRRIAEVHPDMRPAVDILLKDCDSQRHCLVHADFSPKNLLVYPGGLLMVDFETGHYGDPAFDLGFFLSHLLLKSAHHSPARTVEFLDLADHFWKAYRERLGDRFDLAFEFRAMRNLGGCLLARLDGKSPSNTSPTNPRASPRASSPAICSNGRTAA